MGPSTIKRFSTHGASIPYPEVVDIDALAGMTDEDLVLRVRVLDDDRVKAFDRGYDQSPWEEEIAYVRREQQIRRTRRDRHVAFTHDDDEFRRRSESGLPSGDFDNTTFVYASNGGR